MVVFQGNRHQPLDVSDGLVAGRRNARIDQYGLAPMPTMVSTP
jgi:hypothetical protein